MSVREDGDMQRAEIIEVPPLALDGADVRQQAEMRTIRTLAAQAVRVRGLSVPELLQAIEGERNPGVLCDAFNKFFDQCSVAVTGNRLYS